MIPVDDYRLIVDTVPVLCVDIIVRNSTGEYLLIKRKNPPLKNRWWIVGGRVFKGETLEEAARRKVREEVALSPRQIDPVGYFEAVFADAPLAIDGKLHGVSIVFEATRIEGEVHLDTQSSDWKWSSTLPADFHFRPFRGLP